MRFLPESESLANPLELPALEAAAAVAAVAVAVTVAEVSTVILVAAVASLDVGASVAVAVAVAAVAAEAVLGALQWARRAVATGDATKQKRDTWSSVGVQWAARRGQSGTQRRGWANHRGRRGLGEVEGSADGEDEGSG
jgi:hypothetical protein